MVFHERRQHANYIRIYCNISQFDINKAKIDLIFFIILMLVNMEKIISRQCGKIWKFLLLFVPMKFMFDYLFPSFLSPILNLIFQVFLSTKWMDSRHTTNKKLFSNILIYFFFSLHYPLTTDIDLIFIVSHVCQLDSQADTNKLQFVLLEAILEPSWDLNARIQSLPKALSAFRLRQCS